MKDRLGTIFELQERLMDRYRDRGTIPNWPIDIHSKSDQQACRAAGLKCVEEHFEALQHLKNWKPHRQTQVTEFDRDGFIEEMVDSLHYFLEELIFLGVGPDELMDAYVAKNTQNHRRIDEGY